MWGRVQGAECKGQSARGRVQQARSERQGVRGREREAECNKQAATSTKQGDGQSLQCTHWSQFFDQSGCRAMTRLQPTSCFAPNAAILDCHVCTAATAALQYIACHLFRAAVGRVAVCGAVLHCIAVMLRNAVRWCISVVVHNVCCVVHCRAVLLCIAALLCIAVLCRAVLWNAMCCAVLCCGMQCAVLWNVLCRAGWSGEPPSAVRPRKSTRGTISPNVAAIHLTVSKWLPMLAKCKVDLPIPLSGALPSAFRGS